MLEQVRTYLRSSLWVVPALVVAGSVLLAALTLSLDSRVEDGAFTYGGGPDSARSILSTIASAMITFTGLVFSITIVVLQLTSSQYSPRTLRRFFRDRSTQIALGTFIATFTFALIVLREVRSEDGRGVPGISVNAAVVLVLLAMAVFVQYLTHMTKSIQATAIIGAVVAETRDAIDARYPPDRPEPEAMPVTPGAAPTSVVTAARSGVLVHLDVERLVAEAARSDSLVEVLHMTGDYVPEGMPLLRIHGNPVDTFRRPGRVNRIVHLGLERNTEQDPAFGIRQLVDIAERALSTGVNDPTTATQAIDGIHDLMRVLSGRPFPRPERLDEEGRVRALVPEMTWEGYVALAVDEIRRTGADSLQTHRRLRAMLDDLIEAAPPERHPPLRLRLELLDRAGRREFDDAVDLVSTSEGDLQGIGS